jgi:hypothetical protein
MTSEGTHWASVLDQAVSGLFTLDLSCLTRGDQPSACECRLTNGNAWCQPAKPRVWGRTAVPKERGSTEYGSITGRRRWCLFATLDGFFQVAISSVSLILIAVALANTRGYSLLPSLRLLTCDRRRDFVLTPAGGSSSPWGCCTCGWPGRAQSSRRVMYFWACRADGLRQLRPWGRWNPWQQMRGHTGRQGSVSFWGVWGVQCPGMGLCGRAWMAATLRQLVVLAPVGK